MLCLAAEKIQEMKKQNIDLLEFQTEHRLKWSHIMWKM